MPTVNFSTRIKTLGSSTLSRPATIPNTHQPVVCNRHQPSASIRALYRCPQRGTFFRTVPTSQHRRSDMYHHSVWTPRPNTDPVCTCGWQISRQRPSILVPRNCFLILMETSPSASDLILSCSWAQRSTRLPIAIDSKALVLSRCANWPVSLAWIGSKRICNCMTR